MSSVPKSKRAKLKTKMDVEEKADKLVSYVYKIANNESTLPKRYRYTITSDLINSAKSISKLIPMANCYHVNNTDEAKKRLELQLEALSRTFELEKVVDIAYENIEGFSGHTADTFGGYIDEIRNYINKWIKSDKTRIDKLNKNNVKNEIG